MENRAESPTIESLQQQVTELSAKLKWYEEQFRLAQHKRFGASSEQTNPDQMELNLFNEAELLATPPSEEMPQETITYTRRSTAGKREEDFSNLPVETIVYELAEEKRICECCGGSLHEMSTETRNELTIVPAQFKVVKHVRQVYACRHCERHELQTPIVTASMPKPVHPGSMVSSSLLSHVMVQKYVESLPLYRQEKQFERLGYILSRQTMANWMMVGAELWLTPLYEAMKSYLLRQEVLHADETTLQVLREPGKSAESQSYLWLYRTGSGVSPAVLYEYQRTRGGEHPRNFLSGFKGYLQVDGYSGYHKVAKVKLVGCWAHARRKFDEALRGAPPEMGKLGSVAGQGLAYCNQLYAIERELASLTPEERREKRQEKSAPVLEAYRTWLKQQQSRTLPKSLTGQAITYSLNQWEKLTAFLEDGRLELDNNRSERSIKPFVIGRKNWMFANTPRGAKASATIYSVLETAKENGLHPYNYLKYLFEQLPQLSGPLSPEVLKPFMPWSDQLPEACRMPKSKE
ncbi:IS66 family transposase [Cohnella fermenti]|uniref:IS66 family transposase n=1 Tax=Cohnella fermenti TaxID=2565925 RepID=A0A4V3WFV3_9BACL|nr:IS66 family transposase [Cohnella fermenti]THF81688.1 IS66 family transposase [Cohnella fermenti]